MSEWTFWTGNVVKLSNKWQYFLPSVNKASLCMIKFQFEFIIGASIQANCPDRVLFCLCAHIC